MITLTFDSVNPESVTVHFKMLPYEYIFILGNDGWSWAKRHNGNVIISSNREYANLLDCKADAKFHDN